MTTQEAITRLKRLDNIVNNYYSEAIYMAIKAIEQQPCEDCTVIKKLSKKYYVEDAYGYTDEDIVNKVNEIIDVVNDMPSVTPKAEQKAVLDKIRAEIEELKPNNPNFKGYFEQNVALNKVLDIIDKYKTESEILEYGSN